MKNIDYDNYVSNNDIQDISMFNWIQISEISKNLSDEFRSKNNNIPWSDIFGLRNRIVHDYVVLDVVYDTLTKDIPELSNKLFKWYKARGCYESLRN